MAVWPFAAAIAAKILVFPDFIAKNGQKEMLQICPVSVRSRSIEMTQCWLVIGTAISGFFFFYIWVFMLKLLTFLAPKPLQTAETLNT